MIKLEFNVVKNYLRRTDFNILAAPSRNSVNAKFTFSSDWSNISPIVVEFTKSGNSFDVKLEDGECTIPWEVLESSGILEIAVAGGDLITTNVVRINVYGSGIVGGLAPTMASPGVYGEIAALAEEIEKGYSNIKDIMNTYEETVANSENNINTTISNAKTDIANIVAYADTSAANAATSAAEAKAAAETFVTDTTLSIDGRPADAMVVGERLGQFSDKIESDVDVIADCSKSSGYSKGAALISYFFADTQIKSIKPYFTSSEGTFTWCIITSDTDMGLNISFTMGEEHIANIGDTIEINDTLGLRKGIYIKPDTNNALYSTTKKLANQVVATFSATTKINNINLSLSGEYMFTERQIKFVDKDSYNEDISKITDNFNSEFSKLYSNEGITYKIEGTNTNTHMGIYYNVPTYVKTFKPSFSTDFGTFKWYMFESTEDFVSGSTVFTKSEEHIANIGDTIEINAELSRKRIFVVECDEKIVCWSTKSDEFGSALVIPNTTTNTVSEYPAFSLAGELTIITNNINFATHSELNSELYDEHIRLYRFDKVNCSTASINEKWGIYFEKPIYVYTFKPYFSSNEGTFIWFLLEYDNGIFTKGEEHISNIGDTIEINAELSSHNILVLNSAIPMLYKPENDIGLHMIRVTIDDNNNCTATSYSGSTIAGEWKFVENSYKFVTYEILDEKKYISYNDTLPYATNPLFGKKIIALGDSMVAGQGVSPTWLDCVAERNSMTAVNYGIGGNLLAIKDSASSSAMCVRYTEMDEDADYIIIFGGTNDAFSSIPLGDETSTDTSEFYGALNTLLQGIITKYPTKKIGFITPYLYDSAKSTKMQSYIDAIKTACKNNGGIPVFDNSVNGGIDWNNTTQVAAMNIKASWDPTTQDGIHLNATAMEWVSWKYEAFIRSL